MNIFVLDIDHKLCAEYHTDAHVNKLILEAAQLLISAIRIEYGVPGTLRRNTGQVLPYKYMLADLQEEKLGQQTYYTSPSLASNPCCKWVQATRGNFYWLYNHMICLQHEMAYRKDWGNRQHASVIEVRKLLALGLAPKKSSLALTPFVQAMPDAYKNPNAITAYRAYYLAEKVEGAKWTKRDVPWWVR